MDLMWIKNTDFEKEEKPDWVYISNNDNYTIEFLQHFNFFKLPSE